MAVMSPMQVDLGGATVPCSAVGYASHMAAARERGIDAQPGARPVSGSINQTSNRPPPAIEARPRNAAPLPK